MPVPSSNTIPSSNPASIAAAVTPSDTVDLLSVARVLYIGVGGNVNVVMPDGSVVLFAGVGSGSILPVNVRRIMATSTTASSIVALY